MELFSKLLLHLLAGEAFLSQPLSNPDDRAFGRGKEDSRQVAAAEEVRARLHPRIEAAHDGGGDGPEADARDADPVGVHRGVAAQPVQAAKDVAHVLPQVRREPTDRVFAFGYAQDLPVGSETKGGDSLRRKVGGQGPGVEIPLADREHDHAGGRPRTRVFPDAEIGRTGLESKLLHEEPFFALRVEHLGTFGERRVVEGTERPGWASGPGCLPGVPVAVVQTPGTPSGNQHRQGPRKHRSRTGHLARLQAGPEEGAHEQVQVVGHMGTVQRQPALVDGLCVVG